MDQNITKMLFIGAGVLLTIVVIIAGINLTGMGQDMTESATEQTARISSNLNRAQFSAYDGTTVSGSDVTSAISNFRDMEGDITIIVTTGTGYTYNYLSSGGSVSGGVFSGNLSARTSTTTDLANAKDSSNNYYVNPVGQFSATLGIDANDVVRAILFNQQ